MKEYEKMLKKRDNKMYKTILMFLLTINLITFSFLSSKKEELAAASSKAVFNIKAYKLSYAKEDYKYIFNLRESFEKYLGKSVKLKSFFFDEGKIWVEVMGKDEIACIDLLKALEEGEEFFITELSTIENTQEGYKLSFHITTKESNQSK